jgi:hypothetical protein
VADAALDVLADDAAPGGEAGFVGGGGGGVVGEDVGAGDVDEADGDGGGAVGEQGDGAVDAVVEDRGLFEGGGFEYADVVGFLEELDDGVMVEAGEGFFAGEGGAEDGVAEVGEGGRGLGGDEGGAVVRVGERGEREGREGEKGQRGGGGKDAGETVHGCDSLH